MSELHSSRIVVRRIQQAAARDAARSIEGELANLYGTRIESISHDNRGKPAFGLAEAALIVSIVGPLVYKFLDPLLTTAGEAFRDKVVETIRSVRQAPGGPYIVVAIQFGAESDDEFPDAPVRYYFYREVDDDELVKRLSAANEHLKSLPPELLSEPSAPVEYGFFWDKETERWRGCVWRQSGDLYGEGWLPDDIYASNEDED